MIRAFFAIAIIGGLLSGAPLANAQSIEYSALLSGPNENPPNASPATGLAIVDVDLAAHTMHVHIDFTGLLGTTTASHIHSATAIPLSGTAGVATTTPTFAGFPLGVTSGTYDITLDMTQTSSYNPAYLAAHGGTTTQAELDLDASIAASTAYLNIHSTVFPGGEIRGFLVAVPEPATIALISVVVGGAGLLELRRRMKKNYARFARK
jgi:CHRD domain